MLQLCEDAAPRLADPDPFSVLARLWAALGNQECKIVEVWSGQMAAYPTPSPSALLRCLAPATHPMTGMKRFPALEGLQRHISGAGRWRILKLAAGAKQAQSGRCQS